MKHIRYSQSFSFVIFFALLVSPLPLLAMAQDIQSIFHNDDDVYVYLGKELSDIDQVLSRIRSLDHNKNSLVDELLAHIKDDCLLARYDSVLEVLECAETILQSHYKKLSPDQSEQLFNDFKFLVNKVLSGELNVDSHKSSCCPQDKPSFLSSCAPCAQTCILDKNLEVLCKTTLTKHVLTKQGVHIEGELKVDKSAKFKKDVTIKGTLSVTSSAGVTINNLSVVNESLTGDFNLTVSPSTSTAGNILKGGLLFISNTGINNVFVGIDAGNLTTSGVGGNSGFGDGALTALTTGSNNTGVGLNALGANKTGSNNTAVGQDALLINTTGNDNTALGVLALEDSTGSGNTALGVGVLAVNTADNNTGVGLQALGANTIGIKNTAVGQNALLINTTGNANTALGNLTLESNITGSGNTALGAGVLAINTADNNTGVGLQALAANTIGIQNTAVGQNAMLINTTGNANTALGALSLSANITGSDNTAVGFGALGANTIGLENTALGKNALASNVTGNFNTGLGWSALLDSMGNNNTAVGFQALNTLLTGSGNVAVGAGAGSNFTTSESNNICIFSAGIVGDSNTTRIGSGQTRAFVAGVSGVTTGLAAIAVLVDANGQLGTVSSTRRVKHNIEDMDEASANIYQLRPVTFAYNSDASEATQYGLIAEEVDEILPEIVVRDSNNQPATVQYHVLPVLLLNEMKKQQATIEQQHDAIENLNITVASMSAAIGSLQVHIRQFVEEISMLKNKA